MVNLWQSNCATNLTIDNHPPINAVISQLDTVMVIYNNQRNVSQTKPWHLKMNDVSVLFSCHILAIS